MPLYSYVCKAGHRSDARRQVDHRDRPIPCPHDGCKLIAARDVMESMRVHTDTGFSSEQLSRALGVNPNQIAEAQKMFPHHRFAPDGRMIFGSAREMDRVKKDLGFEHY